MGYSLDLLEKLLEEHKKQKEFALQEPIDWDTVIKAERIIEDLLKAIYALEASDLYY